MSKIIVANWKMYLSPSDSMGLFEIAAKKGGVVICPSFLVLRGAALLAQKRGVDLGAQDCFWENRGAYTGEISPMDLKEMGCKYVIVGHSERRGYLQETDEMVGKKVKAGLSAGLVPILCVGESLAQREAGEATRRVEKQLEECLAKVTLNAGQEIIIAYEPIWAIGTGRACNAADAAAAHQLIKNKVVELIGAKKVKVLYGGSVDDKNVARYLEQQEIDGVLVGGASAKKDVFISLLAAAANFE